METLLRNSTLEQLRNYFYDERGEFPPADFTREELISIILKAKQIIYKHSIRYELYKNLTL